LSGPALGRPLLHLEETSSTNDRARKLAIAGAPAGTVVLAEHQTAGRGRQGRSWTMPRASGLALSTLVRFGDPQAETDLTLLPLAAAVAVCETCEAAAPVSCTIKWPNDVLAGGRKLAGILTESRPQSGWAVVGIGLNVNAATGDLDPEIRASATSLRIETGREVDRQTVLELLLARLGVRLAAPLVHDTDSVMAAYRERDALRGRRITWSAGGTLLEGEAQGVDESGMLVVFSDSGERVTLDAGEVHLEASHS
jgi:BirA family biotin operon repressor/biotin-[acetyl-CoA-carboxylase] ligase